MNSTHKAKVFACSLIVWAMTTPAQAAPTAKFTLQYVGSADHDLIYTPIDYDDNNPYTDNLTPGAGIISNLALTNVDLENPTYKTTAWRHYFRILVTFTPDSGNTVERLRAADFSMNYTGNVHPVSPDEANAPTALYTAYSNITTSSNVPEFTTNIDSGNFDDLQDLVVIQASYQTADRTKVGLGATNNIKIDGILSSQPADSPLGVVGFTFNSPYGGPGTISITHGGGFNFSYFTGTTGASITTNTGISGSSLVIGAPEPTSLGMLALGSIVLLARRSKKSQLS